MADFDDDFADNSFDMPSAGGHQDFDGQMVIEDDYDPNYKPTEEDIKEYADAIEVDLNKFPDLVWLVVEGLKAPLPKNWKTVKDADTNELYYFNFETQESSWDHPCDAIYAQRAKEEMAAYNATPKQDANIASTTTAKSPAAVVIDSIDESISDEPISEDVAGLPSDYAGDDGVAGLLGLGSKDDMNDSNEYSEDFEEEDVVDEVDGEIVQPETNKSTIDSNEDAKSTPSPAPVETPLKLETAKISSGLTSPDVQVSPKGSASASPQLTAYQQESEFRLQQRKQAIDLEEERKLRQYEKEVFQRTAIARDNAQQESVEELTKIKAELASAHAARRKALEEEAAELMAAAEQKKADAAAELNRVTATLKEEQSQALIEARKATDAENARKLEVYRETSERDLTKRIDQANIEAEAAVKAKTDERIRELEAESDSILADHAEQLARRRQQTVEERKAKADADLKAEIDADRKAVSAAEAVTSGLSPRDKADRHSDHEQELRALEQTYANEIEALRAAHEIELNELTTKQSATFKAAVANGEERLRAEREEQERRLVEMQATHGEDAVKIQDSVQDLAAKHTAQLQEMESRHASNKSELQKEYEVQRTKLIDDHAAALAKLRAEQEREIELIKEEHASTASSLKVDLQCEMDKLTRQRDKELERHQSLLAETKATIADAQARYQSELELWNSKLADIESEKEEQQAKWELDLKADTANMQARIQAEVHEQEKSLRLKYDASLTQLKHELESDKAAARAAKDRELTEFIAKLDADTAHNKLVAARNRSIPTVENACGTEDADFGDEYRELESPAKSAGRANLESADKIAKSHNDKMDALREAQAKAEEKAKFEHEEKMAQLKRAYTEDVESARMQLVHQFETTVNALKQEHAVVLESVSAALEASEQRLETAAAASTAPPTGEATETATEISGEMGTDATDVEAVALDKENEALSVEHEATPDSPAVLPTDLDPSAVKTFEDQLFDRVEKMRQAEAERYQHDLDVLRETFTTKLDEYRDQLTRVESELAEYRSSVGGKSTANGPSATNDFHVTDLTTSTPVVERADGNAAHPSAQTSLRSAVPVIDDGGPLNRSRALLEKAERVLVNHEVVKRRNMSDVTADIVARQIPVGIGRALAGPSLTPPDRLLSEHREWMRAFRQSLAVNDLL